MILNETDEIVDMSLTAPLNFNVPEELQQALKDMADNMQKSRNEGIKIDGIWLEAMIPGIVAAFRMARKSNLSVGNQIAAMTNICGTILAMMVAAGCKNQEEAEVAALEVAHDLVYGICQTVTANHRNGLPCNSDGSSIKPTSH